MTRSRTMLLGVLVAVAGCQGTPGQAPTRGAGVGRAPAAVATAVPGRTGSQSAPASPGPVVLAPGSTLLPADGGSPLALAPDEVVSAGAGGLINLDGGTLVSADGRALVKADGATVAQLEGATLIAAGGLNLRDGSTQALIAAGGLNLKDSNAQQLIAAGGLNLEGDGPEGAPVGALVGQVRVPPGLGKGGYRLAQGGLAPAPGINVYLRDAAGRFLVDGEGRPVTARTDATGRFVFQGVVALRGVTCFVPLSRGGEGLRGLAAVRPRNARSGEPVAVDPVSTMLAGWIDTSVLGAQAAERRGVSLDRLTAGAASLARQVLVRRLGEGWAGGTLDWQAAACAQETERLRREDGPVAGALEAVKRVMTLAGVSNCATTGLARASLALQQPVCLTADADGAVYVSERYTGVVRRLAPDGGVSTVLGSCSPSEARFGSAYLGDLAVVGRWLYGSSTMKNQVLRISLDGKKVSTVGALGRFAAPRNGLLRPRPLAASGETLLVGLPADAKEPARLVRLGPGDAVTTEPGPWATPDDDHGFEALEQAEDGALWALGSDGKLWLREVEQPWRAVATTPARWPSALLPLPGGDVLVSEGDERGRDAQVVRRHDRQGKATLFTGSATSGLDRVATPRTAARFRRPAGLARLATGQVLVADSQNGLLKAVEGETTAPWAGTVVAAAPSLAAEAVLNLPGGIAVDPQGRVLLTEAGGNTVRRLEAGKLQLLAGGEVGEGSTAASLDGPTTLAAWGEDVYICEAYGYRLRRLGRDGALTTVAGGGSAYRGAAPLPDERLLATSLRFAELLSVTIDPSGRPVFAAGATDWRRAQIWRLEADGTLTWLAGAFDGAWPTAQILGLPNDPREGKPAREVPLTRLAGLAYDKAGNLYLAEPAAARVYRIDPAGRFTTFAGSGFARTVDALEAGNGQREGDVTALDASLLMPIGVACDAAGNVFVAEVGTRVGQMIAGALAGEMGLDVPLTDGRVRRIGPDGKATILAGLGAPLQQEAVRNPMGLAVSPDGRLYVVDNGTSQLKEIVVVR